MKIRYAAFVTAALAALALAVVPAAAHAFGHPGHGPGGDGAEHILRMAKVLGLSDDQTAKVQAIAASNKAGALGGDAAALRTAHEALATAIHDPSATDDQVRDAAAAVAALQAEVAVQRHQMAIQIQAILTPDQKAKLAELMADFKDRHSGPRSGGASGF